MCGIVAVLASPEDFNSLRPKVVAQAKQLRHRGPDWSGVHVQRLARPDGSQRFNILAHERLAIVAPDEGAQPLLDETGQIALSVNGEIYNHATLRRRLEATHTFRSHSDCEVILHLYEDHGADFVAQLDGDFAFVLADERTGSYLVARDPIGVVPLYWGWGADGSLWIASELKALADVCQRFQPFPPGHLLIDGKLVRYYDPAWRHTERVPTGQPSPAELRQALEQASVKRLMSDVPYGVLLSGGLDSSLVASIVSRHAAGRVEDQERTPAWWPRLHSFCIGLVGAPDLAHARNVAASLGTAHHEYHFTVQEGLDALPEVIHHIETFDVTTIRASTPMFLMARKIKAMGVKMVFTGEGSDEIFGGYLYFHKAPDPAELYRETVRKLEALHHYDCLRANKSMAAWGVEARVPFLDQALLDVVMGMDPARKMVAVNSGRMEKHALREAFDDPARPYLPSEVLWRQKEQFSDGVGYGWIDSLRAHAEQQIPDELFALRAYRFPDKTPQTKEGYLYRMIFEQLFPHPSAVAGVVTEPSIACSSAVALEWEAAWRDRADPSGRAILSHQSAYEDKA
jgi:asparagine synthase (glutamine-hydrolysing)